MTDSKDPGKGYAVVNDDLRGGPGPHGHYPKRPTNTTSDLDVALLDTGVLVLFDCRPKTAPIAERTQFNQATSPPDA